MVNNNEYILIVEKYRKPLFKYCYYRLMGNITLVEETLDDIFNLLYKKWDKLDLNDNIRAYLYRVADNYIKYNLKKYNKYYKHHESLEEAMENNRFEYACHVDSYFQGDEMPEEKHIERIIQALPEKYRNIFVYRYVEKKTLMEISELIGLPYSTLRLHLKKIEAIVRDEIKKIFN